VKPRWYDWPLLILALPIWVLLIPAIGLYIVTRDRFDAWRYRH
jgi:hypothetical protein